MPDAEVMAAGAGFTVRVVVVVPVKPLPSVTFAVYVVVIVGVAVTEVPTVLLSVAAGDHVKTGVPSAVDEITDSTVGVPEHTVVLGVMVRLGGAVLIPLKLILVLVIAVEESVWNVVLAAPYFTHGRVDGYLPAETLDSIPTTSPGTYCAEVTV